MSRTVPSMTDEAGEGDRMIQPQRSAIAGDFVAYPSRRRIALLVLGSTAFVAIGLWLAGAFGPAPVTTRYPVEVTIAIGWFSVAFFGLCGIGWTKRLFDTRECVRIGPAGIRWTYWSDETIPWSEIADVRTWSFKRQRSIILHLRDARRFPGRGIAAMMAGANRRMTGGDVCMTLTGTNRGFDEAMAAISRFRRQGE